VFNGAAIVIAIHLFLMSPSTEIALWQSQTGDMWEWAFLELPFSVLVKI
jgi:hypothetical protein